MSRLKAWWSQPDQYDWVTTFLRQRGMLCPARMILAIVAGSSALVPLTVLPSRFEPSAVEMITGGVAATFTVGVTVLWLTRWPTRRLSQAGVVVGALFIGAWSLVQPTGALAALACTAMAVTGGYIAFFHGPRLLLFNGAVAVAVATDAVLRLAHESNLATAASAFWLTTFLNLSVPLGIWGISRAMGTYVQRSEKDALTGLLNRRAFTDAVRNRLTDPPPGHAHLAVVMVDLDNFKRINDTHGHSAGDHALQAVAELLREHTPADALICRAGGEEFLVALTAVTSDVGPVAAQFCAALAGLSPKITASVGTASAELDLLTGPDVAWLIDELTRIADSAMYAAKRRGGNQAHHSVRT
jgi:diguanylate cyclase (GGDEF)-like protein